jgi:hypothetical protein
MDSKVAIYPFNNSIETGLRTLCILNAMFPHSYDLETLVCMDYLCVHTGDFDESVKSLHPENPNRTGELFVRRSVIEEGLLLFISRGLVTTLYIESGIEYQATELSSSFLDKIVSPYSIAMMTRAEWLRHRFDQEDNKTIQQYVKSITSNYAFQTLSK